MVPAFDAEGQMRSVRAWRISEGDTPKRLPPGGHRVSGLVLADAGALAMLQRERAPRRIIVVEGEPNLLTWATWLARNGSGAELAVLGLFSGSWTAEIAASVPGGAAVFIRTDHDAAGDTYGAAVNETLGQRCDVRRLRVSEGA
jgi:hypothetical protein